MTNINYTLLSNDELLDEVASTSKKPVSLQAYLRKNSPELLDEIMRRTDFLDKQISDNISILMRLYCIQNNIQSIPICKNPNCPERHIVGWNKVHHKFRDFCSIKCSRNSEITQEKYKQTCRRNWGVDNPFQSEEVKNRIIETMMATYGVKHALQSKELLAKSIRTSIANNGVQNPFQSKEIRNKAKSTLLKTLNVENPMQSKIIKEKVRQTNQRKYNVDWAMQSKAIQEKSIQTNITNLGVSYPMMSQDVRNKAILTCQKLWGVNNYTQSYEYHKNKRHKYTSEKYPGLTFDSTWEVKVYEFCRDNNIQVEYSPTSPMTMSTIEGLGHIIPTSS